MRFYRRVQFKDYYSVLGVPKTATQDEIRKAYRKLARTHHPDVAKDKKTAESKFKELNEANEVLSDPEKRKRYNELGADWNSPGRQAPPPGWQQGGGMDFGGGGGGFSDFFEAFFGGRGHAGGRKRKGGFGSFAQRGNDVEVELPVHIEEALHGGRKAFNLARGGRTETVTVNIPRGVRGGEDGLHAGVVGLALGADDLQVASNPLVVTGGGLEGTSENPVDVSFGALWAALFARELPHGVRVGGVSGWV